MGNIMSEARRLYKILLVIAGIITLLCSTKQTIAAVQDSAEESKSYEIEFVIDVSGSMTQSEAGSTALEILTGTVELLENTNTKVGVVGYNHEIAYQYPMTNLITKEDKESLIQYLNSIHFHGDTDIGLGLMTAVQEFSDTKGNTQKILLLISDGETDLPSAQKSRTIENSLQDEQEAVALAEEKGIAIYTIGLATRFDGNVDYLSQFSRLTDGKSYAVSSVGQIYEAVSDILKRHYPYMSYTAEKEEQSEEENTAVILPVPDKHLSQISMWIFPAVEKEAIHVLTTSSQVAISQKDCGTRIELKQPPKETITIKLDKASAKESSVMIQGIYNLTEILDIPQKTEKKKETELICRFMDNETGEIISDTEFYESLSVTMIVVDEENKERKTYPTEATESGCRAVIAMEQSGTYKVYAKYQGSFLIGSTEEKEIQFINTQPEQIRQTEQTIPGKFRESVIELDGMFEDKDGDMLVYKLAETENALLCSLDGTKLTVRADQYGDFSVPVQAVDEEGEVCRGEVRIHSIPVWSYYHRIMTGVLAAGILLAGLLISFFIWKYYQKKAEPLPEKKKPEEYLEGVLVGYFLRMENEEEMEPLRWNLTELHRKSMSLKELLEEKQVPVKLPESSRIQLKAGENRTLLIQHDTRCTILHGSKEIARKQAERMYIGEKLYIGFENQVTELELRYKHQ